MPGQAPFILAPANPSPAVKRQFYSTDFQNTNQGINLPKAWSDTGIVRPVDLRVAGDIFYSYVDGQDVGIRNELLDVIARRFAGLQTKPSADIAIVDPAVVPGALTAGATFQGVTLASGMTVLLAPPDGAANATIYEVQATGAPVIPEYADNPDLAPSSSVRIQQGQFAERLFIFVNDEVPAAGDILRWEPQAVPVLTNAGAGVGYDADTNSYYIRNEDGSITIDPDGVHVSAQYTQDMVDRINAAVMPLVNRISTLEGLTTQHTTQIAGLLSDVAQLRTRLTAVETRLDGAEARLDDAEANINNLQIIDWTVPFPGDAATITNPDSLTTLITIDLTKARWYGQLGLTLDILNSLVYAANPEGGVKQVEAASGLMISEDGRTARLQISPRSDAGTVLLHRMQDARPISSGTSGEAPPAANTAGVSYVAGVTATLVDPATGAILTNGDINTPIRINLTGWTQPNIRVEVLKNGVDTGVNFTSATSEFPIAANAAGFYNPGEYGANAGAGDWALRFRNTADNSLVALSNAITLV